MNYKKCVYFVEVPCEKQLIEVLNKQHPYRLVPGKVTVQNPIQKLISRGTITTIAPGTEVVFVFDTDVENTDIFLKNIQRVKDYARQVRIVNLAQVLNFEDEIARATDVRRAQELTGSAGVSNFKSDFCRMKRASCRSALEHHHLDVGRLWTTTPPNTFSFIEQESERVKI